MSDLNIFQRMSKITDELQVVAKNLTVGYGKSAYKAVGERDVLDAVKPAEIKWGVYSYPFSREILEAQTLEKADRDGNKSTVFFSRIQTTYRFVNIDNPSEYIDIVSFAEGIDPADKGSGKAMTYADKYALLKAYKISTGDDPDKDPSEPLKYGKADDKKSKNDEPKQERPPVERAEYPAKEQKQILMDTAATLGKDVKDILRQAGWKDGTKLNWETYNKSLVILKEISDAQRDSDF